MTAATPAHHHLTSATWRRYSEWPLAAAAVVFLITFSLQVIENVPDSRAEVYDLIIWTTWAVFVIDYLVNLWLAERRARWFVHNLHELAILALPMLRPLRLMRLLSVLRLTHRVAGRALRGRVLTYAFGGALLLCYAAALAVLDAEQNDPGSNIKNIGDALWWAAVTIAGVGYGDHYPVTLVGRLVGVGLMIGGIALIAVVAGSLAAWMIESLGNRVEAVENAADDDLRAELARVSAQLAVLTTTLTATLSGATGLASSPVGAASSPAAATTTATTTIAAATTATAADSTAPTASAHHEEPASR